MEQTTSKLIESLDLPQDLFLGMPSISMTGNREMNISNHRGILSYEADEITILAKHFHIRIKGRALIILSYTQEELQIKGYIFSVEFI